MRDNNILKVIKVITVKNQVCNKLQEIKDELDSICETIDIPSEGKEKINKIISCINEDMNNIENVIDEYMTNHMYRYYKLNLFYSRGNKKNGSVYLTILDSKINNYDDDLLLDIFEHDDYIDGDMRNHVVSVTEIDKNEFDNAVN